MGVDMANYSRGAEEDEYGLGGPVGSPYVHSAVPA
jgi:hypothetical protein